MKPWTQRPREIRNLFNPAFCGLVLHRGIEGFQERSDRGMPFSLTLLLLPLSLHKKTREAVQQGSRSYFCKVISKNPEIVIDLAPRIRGLLPYTFEGLGILMHSGSISVSDAGEVETVGGTVTKSITGTEESRACQMAARTLGRKFADVNDRVTIYTTLGIRP